MDALRASFLEMLRPILFLPLWQKLLALFLVVVVIFGLYGYLIWMPLQDDISRKQGEVALQKSILQRNLRLAQDFPRKQKEYADLEQQLKVALAMLPKKSQLPDLLENVSWAGKDSGLEFKNFKPEREVVRQIYAEVPVALHVSGSFRQLLTFLKRVGEMPRIVDVKYLKLSRKPGEDRLSIQGKAVTYRFVDPAALKKQ